MTLPTTYQLTISFPDLEAEPGVLKEAVKDWLMAAGVSSFVEGSLEDLDIDHEFGQPERDFYGELGGDRSPVILYAYERSYLEDLASRLTAEFGQGLLTCELSGMETSLWMEGWKESFKPIRTERFYIYPPWEELAEPALIPLMIDPGMAFGTGQHATTQVCLRVMEGLFSAEGWQGKTFLDVGTGSGILSIAAKKIGCSRVDACDIDGDAVTAARLNAEENTVDLNVWKGSVPTPAAGEAKAGYDVVVANILFVVLAKMIDSLAGELAPGGHLILSGLLVEQQEEMLELASQAKLELISDATCEGWVALVLRHAAA